MDCKSYFYIPIFDLVIFHELISKSHGQTDFLYQGFLLIQFMLYYVSKNKKTPIRFQDFVKPKSLQIPLNILFSRNSLLPSTSIKSEITLISSCFSISSKFNIS